MLQGSTRPRACGRRRRCIRWGSRAPLAALLLSIAVASADAAPWPEEQFNPAPAADDVILPMPCGGAMAFRKVVIPSDGPLADRPITVGEADDSHGFAESTRPAYIAGSFSAANQERYFLLGKYEVSQLQYQSLGSPCPKPTAEAELPQADIGWIDAVDFADRYSRWLGRNAADKMPKEESELGFVRLPTEVEWEFAARGGIKVSEAEFVERVFPMSDGDMVGYVWYAGPSSSNNKVQRIGLLKPNPLGFHDILGNVDEMTFEPFRLNKLDRLHGQAGGFIVRGSNFTTAEQDVRTSYRHEVPFYRDGEPRRSKTTGFRLAVVAPVITSRERLRAITEEWETLGTTPTAPAVPGTGKVPGLGDVPLDDPVKELAAIVAATADANMQKRLKGLQLAFRASYQARDEQRDRAAKARLRLGTFLCQKLRSDGLPIDQRKDVYKACVEARGAEHERCVGQKAIVDQEEAAQYDVLGYYADTIVTLSGDYDAEVVGQQGRVLRSELKAKGLQELIPVVDTYERHVAEYRKQKTITRSQWLDECKTGK